MTIEPWPHDNPDLQANVPECYTCEYGAEVSYGWALPADIAIACGNVDYAYAAYTSLLKLRAIMVSTRLVVMKDEGGLLQDFYWMPKLI